MSQSSMESINDTIHAGATDRGGQLVVVRGVHGSPTSLRIYDNRGRCMDVVSVHRFPKLIDALKEGLDAR